MRSGKRLGQGSGQTSCSITSPRRSRESITVSSSLTDRICNTESYHNTHYIHATCDSTSATVLKNGLETVCESERAADQR